MSSSGGDRRLGAAGEYEVAVYYLPKMVRYSGAEVFGLGRWPQSDVLAQVQMMTVDGVTRVSWQRRLDEISETTVEASKAGMSRRCGDRLGDLQPWQMELAIYRDGQLVWQGPIVEITEGREKIIIRARDVLCHLERSPIPQGLGMEDNADLTDLALGCIAFRLWHVWAFYDQLPYYDWMGIAAYVRATPTGTIWPGAAIDPREPIAYSNPYEELQKIARTGLDFTTLNRSVIFRGPATAETPASGRLQDQHFLSELEVVVAGEDLVTWAFGYSMVRDEATLQQYAAVFNWERRSFTRPSSRDPLDLQTFSPWGEHGVYFEGETETEPPARLLRRAIGRSRSGYPVPVIVRVPDGAQLSPDAPVDVNELVCGQRFDVEVTSYLRPAETAMRLASVQGDWVQDGEGEMGEKISVSLVPVAGEDS